MFVCLGYVLAASRKGCVSVYLLWLGLRLGVDGLSTLYHFYGPPSSTRSRWYPSHLRRSFPQPASQLGPASETDLPNRPLYLHV
ncbi:hypothetical protein GGR55DRAFT_651524 [Xylaria sp. FL0064]|nr:hypothetical protein GGR55DRAFT_651524 [Xylaria sp. FL0064]